MMSKQYFYYTVFFLIIGITPAFAQKQVKGRVTDLAGKPVESVNVNLKDLNGNILSYTRTNEKGVFNLTYNQENLSNLSIEASSIGYMKSMLKITDPAKNYDLVLEPSAIKLQTVNVKNSPSLLIRGDTLNYKTADFSDKQDRSIGDVLKKMPGIEVAENGKVSYNGKAISKLYIDGDNLLDDRYNIGTKSIPHGAVDKVQVIENDQPVKMMRKNNMSEDVALNLVIKDEAKLKVMGDATAGLGTPERFDENVTAMLFNKKLKFINNINGNNIGNDPGIDLTSHNLSDYLRRLENNKPDNLLSTGAAGVPSLPQNRYLFNKAGAVNLNNLYKLNPDLQLRANLSYLYDKRKQQYNKFSQTYLPDQVISYSESQNNAINPQKLRAQFNLNSNAEKHYLDNTFILEYAPTETHSSIIINNVPANQSLKQKTFDLSNELNYKKTLKSNDIINLYSYINRSSHPETLNITPGLNADILNNGVPYKGLDQYVTLPTWYANNYASFAFVKGGFMQTYKAGFNLQKQQLNSSLYKIQNDQVTELATQNAVNDVDWLKTKLYSEATYEYTNQQLKASISLPFSYNLIRYNDQINDFDKKLNRFFINPTLNMKYQISAENYVTTDYSFKNELGGIEDIYQGIILKNYRSLFSNNAPVTEKKVHSAAAVFNFRKATQMLFVNIGANYSFTTLNTISSYTLNNNIQQRVVLPLSNDISALILSANASKYLFALKSTVSGGVSFNQSSYKQLQNNDLLPYRAQTITYKATIEAKITSAIKWSYNASYATTINKALAETAVKTTFSQLRQQSTLSFSVFTNTFVNLSAEHLYTHQFAQQDLKYIFADMNIRYKLTKIRTDLEFGVTNLANIKSFEAINVSSNSLTSGTYYIPGRVAMLKGTFNF